MGITFSSYFLIHLVETVNVLRQRTIAVKVSASTATITLSDLMEMKNLLNMSQPRIIISMRNYLDINI